MHEHQTTGWRVGDTALWETNSGDRIRVIIGHPAPPGWLLVSPENDPKDGIFVKPCELEPVP